MYNYRSKCRWSILLYVGGVILEIRPGEYFESKDIINIKHLEKVKPLPKKIKKYKKE